MTVETHASLSPIGAAQHHLEAGADHVVLIPVADSFGRGVEDLVASRGGDVDQATGWMTRMRTGTLLIRG